MTSTSTLHRTRTARLVALALVGISVLLWLGWRMLPMLAPTLSSRMQWSPTPIAGVTMECFEESTPEKWSYCVSTTDGSDSRDVLYHLHGRRGAADWWNDREYYSGDVHGAWLAAGSASPRVVTVSFGPLWLLTEVGAEPHERRLRTFIDVVMPHIESKLGGIGRRMVVGESMGGVNALILAMSNAANFDRVAALCAPLSEISPHEGPWGLVQAARKANASLGKALLLSSLGRWAYPTEALWTANDPLQRFRRRPPASIPRLYISCGERDPWGCLPASQVLVAELRTAGHAVQWHQRPGGHCDVEAKSLARFLAP